MAEETKQEGAKNKRSYSIAIYVLLILTVGLAAFNQYQISNIMGNNPTITGGLIAGESVSTAGIDLSNVDISELKSTAHSIAALFPVNNIRTTQDAVDIMIPVGTPEYGDALGISYDDPVSGLSELVDVYRTIQLSAEENQRYVSLVTKPVGISCEHCCGVGAVGVDANGNSICGCQHNPALLGLTKWLMKNTDYSDAEVLKEVIKWKSLFFPKNMIQTAMDVAGKDISELDKLPGMVGGC